MSFEGEWRRYQLLALEAFSRDVAAGRRRTHIVAPPGSGKTLLGVELCRRVGRPAVVLAPNTAVQAQWPRAVARFSGAVALEALTYQALCRVEDPGGVLADAAFRQWAAERAAATGEPVAAVVSGASSWSGAAAERRDREVARITAGLKRAVARGAVDGVSLGDLLTDGARARVREMQEAGVGVIVLDECHHLASMWGYLICAVLEELGGDDVHVIGLTATPPAELTAEEASLYETLLGPVDFTVPTPAVVRDGFLARTRSSRGSPSRSTASAAGSPSTTCGSPSSSPACTTGRSRSGSSTGSGIATRRRAARRCRGSGSRSAAPRSPGRGCASSRRPACRCPTTRPAARRTAARPTSRTGSCCWRPSRYGAWRPTRRRRRPGGTRRSRRRCATSGSR